MSLSYAIKLGTYLKWTEVGFHCLMLIANAYVLYIIYTTKIINNIEWNFTKLSIILDALYSLVGIIYYTLYTIYPKSILVCQIGGVIKPTLYAICVVSVLILMSIRFFRYVLHIVVKDLVWYSILIFLIILDLILCLYFAINKKMVPTILGYCFINPLQGNMSRFASFFVIVLATISILIIIVNYALLCRLGLQMGTYINSEELQMDKNSIVEKSILIVVTKSVAITSTYLILILPKLVTAVYTTIHLKSINDEFDVVADFLLGLNSFPNLLTTILLNSTIRGRIFSINANVK
jgi:hypothetical protein